MYTLPGNEKVNVAANGTITFRVRDTEYTLSPSAYVAISVSKAAK